MPAGIRLPNRFTVIFLLLIFFSAMPFLPAVWAGEFFADFNTGLPSGAKILGHAAVLPEGGVNGSGALKLTAADEMQVGSLALDPLDGNMPVHAFTVEFKMLMGGGSGGDGLGLMFLSQLPSTPFHEQTRGTGITVVFDSYKNRPNQVAPSVRLYANLAETAVFPLPDLRQNQFVDVQVKLDAAGRLNVSHDRHLVISNFQTIKINQAGQFGFAARTGSVTDNHLLDDLKIVTEINNPHLDWVEPTGDNVSPKPLIRIGLKKSLRNLDEKDAALTLDGKPLAYQAVFLTDRWLVTSEPDELLKPGSTHQVNFTFHESGKKTPHLISFNFTISTKVRLSR